MTTISYTRSSAVASSHQTLCGKGLLSALLLYTGSDVVGFGLSALGLLERKEIAIWFIASCSCKSLKTKEEYKRGRFFLSLVEPWVLCQVKLLLEAPQRAAEARNWIFLSPAINICIKINNQQACISIDRYYSYVCITNIYAYVTVILNMERYMCVWLG